MKIERDYNFSRDIRREEDITRYCNMLIKYACVYQKEHILPLYYFLQTAIRYMQLEIDADEQSLSSLSKLAKTAVADIPEESCFHDIIVRGYVRSTDSTSHITMFGFLSLFEGASDADTGERIVRQISRIRRNYPLSNKLAG